ncbi:hypothetical protein [Chromobacterium haemolyticum]|uniref:hypothetical protein n=1 Tax=Chromobacterium haemolyticum TaxID=394935 RepID=UPI002953033F|nr:hypothetical protein [Chromobacterium haemolyticum]WON83871.1 hypothetical protein OK026_22600 [Chromobacterium haemolyticum]
MVVFDISANFSNFVSLCYINRKKILKPSLISTKLLEDTLILNDKLFQLAPVGLYVFEKNSNKELKSNASAKEFLKNITETEKNYFLLK